MAYVALDGPDGGGKSTQALALCEHVRQLGRSVVHLREPGSTPVGEALRDLLLATSTGQLRPVTEALLFSAARAELVERVIAPALQRGEVVISERCFVSTLAYQGLAYTDPAKALDYDWLLDLTRRVHGSTLPDAVFVLDVDAEQAQRRCEARTKDRFESRDAAFYDSVRSAYREIAERDPSVVLVDANQDEEQVQQQLRGHLARWLG